MKRTTRRGNKQKASQGGNPLEHDLSLQSSTRVGTNKNKLAIETIKEGSERKIAKLSIEVPASEPETNLDKNLAPITPTSATSEKILNILDIYTPKPAESNSQGKVPVPSIPKSEDGVSSPEKPSPIPKRSTRTSSRKKDDGILEKQSDTKVESVKKSEPQQSAPRTTRARTKH